MTRRQEFVISTRHATHGLYGDIATIIFSERLFGVVGSFENIQSSDFDCSRSDPTPRYNCGRVGGRKNKPELVASDDPRHTWPDGLPKEPPDEETLLVIL